MNSEQYAAEFERNFMKYKEEQIALYGLGKNTVDILNNIKGYSFCVVSNEHIGEEFHGYKVLSVEEAIKCCKVLIIVAINRSIKTIFNRIEILCPLDMFIFDMGGRNLRNIAENKEEVKNFFVHQRNDVIGKTSADSYERLGYVFFSPFVILMLEKMKQLAEQQNAFFLLSSRDCYIFHYLFENDFRHWKISQKYLYVSRRALGVSGIKTNEDIKRILTGTCGITRGDLVAILEERLGVEFADERLDAFRGNSGEICPACREICSQVVNSNLEVIKANAFEERQNYCRYVKSLDIPKDKKVFFVDLVTRGSNYRAFRDMTGIDCSLLCLAYRDELGEMSENDICSVYEYASRFSRRYLLHYYEMLEIAFSSKEGQLQSMSPEGKPIYTSNTQYVAVAVEQMQQGIVKAVNEYFQTKRDDAVEYEINLADNILGLLDGLSREKINIREGFTYTDSIMGRTRLNMWDLLIG